MPPLFFIQNEQWFFRNALTGFLYASHYFILSKYPLYPLTSYALQLLYFFISYLLFRVRPWLSFHFIHMLYLLISESQFHTVILSSPGFQNQIIENCFCWNIILFPLLNLGTTSKIHNLCNVLWPTAASKMELVCHDVNIVQICCILCISISYCMPISTCNVGYDKENVISYDVWISYPFFVWFYYLHWVLLIWPEVEW